jgi:hypothetical protein
MGKGGGGACGTGKHANNANWWRTWHRRHGGRGRRVGSCGWCLLGQVGNVADEGRVVELWGGRHVKPMQTTTCNTTSRTKPMRSCHGGNAAALRERGSSLGNLDACDVPSRVGRRAVENAMGFPVKDPDRVRPFPGTSGPPEGVPGTLRQRTFMRGGANPTGSRVPSG